ncbi:Ferredoxin-dependent bilin reductase [Ruminiclostridium papyrosolvens]|uniref:Ferredoxin-dependent bilin reductase n=1 Tax=Ruminiclostridium papyrosolvens C7 TaxID=1330534 RepID=U4R0S5_9FIRM|nr:Ferredoxin-dependent bilin reductase [Ruminiclostridium papyrosolvens]EPR10358.1 Ferredoxin-dependent bilin reductase [Ruminiclostridium papyrosolvens C7]
MRDNSVFSSNKKMIEKEIKDGLNILNNSYKLNEINCGQFSNLQIQNIAYNIKQYEIVGVGNLLLMESKDSPELQMLSFVITPYYKNLPLFSSDYLFIGEKRNFLVEYYDLVSEKDSLYNSYLDKLRAIKDKYEDLPDMKLKECWYDSLKTVCIAKKTTIAQDDIMLSIFNENLHTFIETEQQTDILTESEKKVKCQITRDYVNKLVDSGGVSTNVFKNSMGAESTKKFFNDVFFGTEKF